jgi:hypothetical protein
LQRGSHDQETKMKRLQTTDFDVITGPSMATACPVVETPPLPALAADAEKRPQAEPAAKEAADAA